MSTLVLRLAGPLQAWPAAASFDQRPTRPTPTYSALVGLLQACLGFPRDHDGRNTVHPIVAGCRIATRVDRTGRILDDYHTINPWPARVQHGDPKATSHPVHLNRTADDGAWMVGSPKGVPGGSGGGTGLTTRSYLSDAEFVALIEAADDDIDVLTDAVRNPVFTPFLGRKSCPPADPWVIGVASSDLETAAQTVPLVDRSRKPRSPNDPTIVDLVCLWADATGARFGATEEHDEPAGRVGRHYRLRARHTRRVTVENTVTDIAALMAWSAATLT